MSTATSLSINSTCALQSQVPRYRSPVDIHDSVIVRAETGSRSNTVSEGRKHHGCLGKHIARIQYAQAAEASSHEGASSVAGTVA
jgi:phosphopantetheine adenylyltransferase